MIRTTLVTLGLLAIASTSSAQAAGPRLSLDEAVAMALQNNRSLQTATLQALKADHDLENARTRRLPSFSLEAQAQQLLSPVDITFRQGAFGTFPGTGPVPATDTILSTPAGMSVLMNAQVSQPLTQLFKLNLNVRLTEAARGVEQEQLRASQLSIVNEVKRLYYAILETTSALAAADHNISLLTELNRVVSTRVAQRVALRGDGLDVETRLGQIQLTRLTLDHTLASRKEQLNQLLGRDVGVEFDIDGPPEVALDSHALAQARSRVIASRPDIRQARLRVEQAGIARRMARADYLPEVSLGASYLSPMNIDGAPRNIASASLVVQWEPFDWGRRNRAVATRALELQQAEHALADAEARATLEVNQRFRSLEESRARLRVARLAQDAAREHARVRLTQYEVESALLSDVLSAQAALTETSHQQQQALLGYLTATADLEHALGEEVSR